MDPTKSLTLHPSKFFASNNIYEQLLNVADEPVENITEKATSSSSGVKPEEAESIDIAALNLTQGQDRASGEQDNKLIPPFNTNFWRVYGNRLRVFGTVEEMCDLTQKRIAQPRAEGSNTVDADTTKPSTEQTGDRRGSIWDTVRSYIP